MARESQGLQIALIVFVLFTIALGVYSFMAFGWYKEALVKANANLAEANKRQGEAKALEEEVTELKRLIGVGQAEKIDAIQQQFKRDMEEYSGAAADPKAADKQAALPADKQYYRPALAVLTGVLKDRNGKWSDTIQELEDFKKKYQEREATKDAQLKQHQDAVAKASQDTVAATAQTKVERDRLSQQITEVKTQHEAAVKEKEAAVTEADKKVKESSLAQDKVVRNYNVVKEQLNAVTKDNPDVAGGSIISADQRSGIVLIDRGQADRLQRQATFSVYSGETTDLSKTGKKASIEVVRLLGEHMAEARVTEDSIADPILPGDKIYTPVWRPGEQRHFALAGFMDIDGDGHNDADLVRNLITMNGGVIDAEIDEKGKRVGEISPATKYLVLGDTPDARSARDTLEAYSKMIDEAARLGVQKITVAEMLNRMGWKSPSQIVRFGTGGNAGKLPVPAMNPTKGVQPVSRGNVSEIYRNRQPPRASGASTY